MVATYLAYFKYDISFQTLFSLFKYSAFVEKELKSIDDKKEKALEHAGDSEVVDAMYDKAKLYCSAGYWEEANTAYDEVINTKKKITSNKKIDAYCEKSRIALYTMNVSKLSDLLEETKKLNESGGDWDRRNRLKVYEALYFISNNEVKKAGPLLLECIETFTCTEICTYESFIFYTVLINIITLPRTELYKKVIKNPQVIAMIG